MGWMNGETSGTTPPQWPEVAEWPGGSSMAVYQVGATAVSREVAEQRGRQERERVAGNVVLLATAMHTAQALAQKNRSRDAFDGGQVAVVLSRSSGPRGQKRTDEVTLRGQMVYGYVRPTAGGEIQGQVWWTEPFRNKFEPRSPTVSFVILEVSPAVSGGEPTPIYAPLTFEELAGQRQELVDGVVKGIVALSTAGQAA